jgi:hypothetical protein
MAASSAIPETITNGVDFPRERVRRMSSEPFIFGIMRSVSTASILMVRRIESPRGRRATRQFRRCSLPLRRYRPECHGCHRHHQRRAGFGNVLSFFCALWFGFAPMFYFGIDTICALTAVNRLV